MGGGSVRFATGTPISRKNSSWPEGEHRHSSRAGRPDALVEACGALAAAGSRRTGRYLMSPIIALMTPVDVTKPNTARMYDYWLGGKDNFEADREAAEAIRQQRPNIAEQALDNKKFQTRAITYVAGPGVRQFLDIGSGLPTNRNVHEVAQHVNADARVVYADIDPVVVAHARALLSGPQTAAIRADACRPDDILGAPEVRRLIDFSRPVAVLLLAVLHLIPDEADPAGSVARLR